MTTPGTTVLATTAAPDQPVSLKDSLAYLQEQFLPVIQSSSAINTTHFNVLQLPAPKTPLQSKAVGAVDLQQQQPSFQTTEDALSEVSKVLTKHMDDLFVKASLTTTTTASAAAVSPSLAVQLIEALDQSLDGVISVTSSREKKLSAFRTLLTFSNKLMETMDQEALARSCPDRQDLAGTICRVFRHLEKVPFHRSATHVELSLYSDCFCACLQHLSKYILILESLPMFRGNEAGRFNHDGHHVLTGLYNALEDWKLVESILFQQRPLERMQEVTPLETSSVLDFFSLLATCGDPKMLSLLVYDEISSLLNEVLRTGSIRPSNNAQQTTIRGYRPVETKPTRKTRGILKTSSMAAHTGWEEDPKHNNVIRVYEFLAVLLQAADTTFSPLSASGSSNKVKERFLDKALYCVDRNQRSVRECLQQVIHAINNGTQGLTMQILREASAIMALLTELCDQGIDLFLQKHAQLYQDITKDAQDVMLSMCIFLGASGIARELFCQMEDNGGSGNGIGAGLISPIIDVFLDSGRNNTRHESIQFSHFVSAASGAISVTERQHRGEHPKAWAPSKSSPGATNGGPFSQQSELTESSLEQNSRRALTTVHQFELELEAAKCLFHACSAQWVNHPSCTSFVEFNSVELSKQRDISWIKVGDVVGFRKDDYERSPIELGEVEFVDTINLCCAVRPMNNKENHQSIVVPLLRLAGVEDRTKRKGVMAFSHAPETSSDLQKSQGLSVGHLVLAMRWCQEYSVEQEQQGTTSKKEWIRMNAEVLSLLLAKEVSLQRESGALNSVPPNVANMLNAQLLDVFGDQAEFSSFVGAYATDAMRKTGRLHDLLPPNTWNTIRGKLKSELDAALAHVKVMQEKAAARHQHRRMY